MKFFFKKFLPAFVILSALCFILGIFFFQLTEISSIQFKIDSQFQDDRWNNELKKKIVTQLESYKGRKIWNVRLGDISKDIYKIYPAGRIQVHRQWPHQIVVVLKETSLAFLLLRENGLFYPISFRGDIQEPLSEGKYLDLPILRGSAFYKDKSLVQKALQILIQLPQKGIFTSRNISEISHSSKEKSFVIFLIPGHFVLNIGLALEEKQIEKINFVLNYLFQNELTGHRVDARFKKKIIVNKMN